MSTAPALAAGIDLGGTKIEAQVFAADWSLRARHRIDTPGDYDGLLTALVSQLDWIAETAGTEVPVGLAAAGLINPINGLALTANLSASGRPLPADLAKTSGRAITWINDCRALALSEALLGAGKGRSPVVGLILGTGIGGGVVVDGKLLAGHTTTGGEFGHFPVSAAALAAFGLPVIACGCGRMGCSETMIAGPGLTRIAKTLLGRDLSAPEITASKSGDAGLARVWAAWCALAADLLVTLIFTIDPAVIVLGGGLSAVPGLADDLSRALKVAMFRDFPLPEIVVAEGGDASGARGAALAAFESARHV